MEVIVIRHSIALGPEPAQAAGLSDGERPLTDHGKRYARAAAAGMRAVLAAAPVNTILTSPLLRARQTSEILAGYLDDPPADETDALAPATTMAAIDSELHQHFGAHRVLLVGHEPILSHWVSWSLTRRHDRLLAFKTTGAALLAFPGAPEGGTGTLRWLLTPEQLHALH
jgi:phosphohistidine phosphatase